MPYLSRMMVNSAAQGYGVYTGVLGVAVLLGGEHRFDAPSLVEVKSLVAGLGIAPHVTWATLFLIIAVLVLGPRTMIVGLYLACVVMCFFAFGLCWSIFHDPVVPVTGVVTYLFLAFVAAGLLVAKRGVV